MALFLVTEEVADGGLFLCFLEGGDLLSVS